MNLNVARERYFAACAAHNKISDEQFHAAVRDLIAAQRAVEQAQEEDVNAIDYDSEDDLPF